MNRATSLILNPSESKVEASERPAEVEVVEIPLDVTAGELEVDLAESIADARIGLPGRLHLVWGGDRFREVRGVVVRG